MSISRSDGERLLSTVTLDLYVSRHSADSDRALDNLRVAIQERTGERFPQVRLIDVHESPLVAYREGIIVTPTLIVTINGVATKMIGNLSDPQTTSSLLARIL